MSVPSPKLIGQSISLGTEIPTESEWETIWGATGLKQQVLCAYKLEPEKELGDRIKRVGWRWILPAWGRAFKLVVFNKGFRQSIKEQFNVPKESMDQLGYILLSGCKTGGEMD